mgnify:CR=1 FL=1
MPTRAAVGDVAVLSTREVGASGASMIRRRRSGRRIDRTRLAWQVNARWKRVTSSGASVTAHGAGIADSLRSVSSVIWDRLALTVVLTGATLLFFHGNGEIVADYDDIAPAFNQLGLNFMAVDYRGYGCSQGTPTVSAMMADCHRIFDFTEKWKVETGFSGPMIVMGRSLGSASALELAASYPDRFDGLIIESGFAWAGPLLRRLGVEPEGIGYDESAGFANVDKIKRFDKPTVIIHAEFDHIIPFGDGKTLYDASPAGEKKLVTIFGANHNDIFLRGLDRYLEAVVDLARAVTGQRS